MLDGTGPPVRGRARGDQGERHGWRAARRTLTVSGTVHGPGRDRAERLTVAMRVAAIDRPRLFEQFWRMGLAHTLDEWQAAMRMQQLPLFNTTYADRDGHIAYVYNATLPVHPTGDYQFWQGVVAGDRPRSSGHASPLRGLPDSHRSADWLRCRTATIRRGPRRIRCSSIRRSSPRTSAPRSGITERSQRSIRLLSQSVKITSTI